MSDFTAQEACRMLPRKLFPNTPTVFGSHPDTLDALLPWLTADGEPIFIQILEEDEVVCNQIGESNPHCKTC